MDNTFQIIKNNLIGGLASAILTLKKIEEKAGDIRDLRPTLDLIDFLRTALTEDYKELLFEKNFIVSKEALQNIHNELKEKEVLETIDFSQLKQSILEISNNSSNEKIEKSVRQLKEIALALRQIKYQKEIYM